MEKKQGKNRVQVVHPNVGEDDKKKGSIKVYGQTVVIKQCWDFNLDRRGVSFLRAKKKNKPKN